MEVAMDFLFKIVLFIFISVIYTISSSNILYSQEPNCPDSIDSSPGNSDGTIEFEIFNSDGEVIDTFECKRTGGSNQQIDCDLDSLGGDSYYISPINSGNGENNIDECVYDTNGEHIGYLPIELEEFSVKNDNNTNSIKWITATETNNDYFVLEHSHGDNVYEIDNNWKEIIIKDGCGTCNYTNYYNYEHIHYKDNKVNYYRLTQYDYNGLYETFDVISIDNNENKEIVKVLNYIGQEVTMDYKDVKIILYSNGTTKKIK